MRRRKEFTLLCTRIADCECYVAGILMFKPAMSIVSKLLIRNATATMMNQLGYSCWEISMCIQYNGLSMPHAKILKDECFFWGGECDKGLNTVCEQKYSRWKHSLDLVFTDMTDFAASSLATVADHRCVQTTVQFKVSETLTNQCEVWHFKYEDLEKLHRKIEDIN